MTKFKNRVSNNPKSNESVIAVLKTVPFSFPPSLPSAADIMGVVLLNTAMKNSVMGSQIDEPMDTPARSLLEYLPAITLSVKPMSRWDTDATMMGKAMENIFRPSDKTVSFIKIIFYRDLINI